ncbi:hypothetical protein V2I01_25290 [Micromonospora sp. BRA006-A]|nr:hypothetical protein [Micromonospora sp. BRA006-A]
MSWRTGPAPTCARGAAARSRTPRRTPAGRAGRRSRRSWCAGEWWYLFVCCDGTDYGAAYRRTAVYRSRDPLRFDGAEKVTVLDAHAAEVVVDGSNWYLTHAGWGQGGLWLAPLTWSTGVVARGWTVTTGFLRADVRTWPQRPDRRAGRRPGRGRQSPSAPLDSSHRGTGPYLAVGRFDVTDRGRGAGQVAVSADGSRINLVGIPFGDEPVTADWLLATPRWTGPGLQSDVTWSVNGWPTAAVWEVAFNIDGASPLVGDPAVEARPTGDVTGMPRWTMSTGDGLSVVAAHRWGRPGAATTPGTTPATRWRPGSRCGAPAACPGRRASTRAAPGV